MADAARNHPRAGGVVLAVAAAVLLMPAVGMLSATQAQAAGSGVSVSLTDDSGGLAPWIQVDVEVGGGGGHGSCTGFSGSPVYSGALADLTGPPGDGYLDMTDPKLLGASRTWRGQMLVFPHSYRPWQDR